MVSTKTSCMAILVLVLASDVAHVVHGQVLAGVVVSSAVAAATRFLIRQVASQVGDKVENGVQELLGDGFGGIAGDVAEQVTGALGNAVEDNRPTSVVDSIFGGRRKLRGAALGEDRQ